MQNFRSIKWWKTSPFLLLFSLFLGTLSYSYSLDFGISPIRIFITPEKTTAVFEIKNLSDKKIFVETDISKWDQDEKGNDLLIPTENMVVVPPYIELEPKQKQLVRLAYLDGFNQPQEYYRLILRQVPEKIKPEKNPKKIKTLIQVVLNISVPVFVNKTNDLSYELVIHPEEVTKERVVFVAQNKGNAFTRIVKVGLFKGEKEIYSKSLAKYILPKKHVYFEIKKTVKDGEGKLKEVPFDEIPDKMVIVLEDEKEFTIRL